MNSSEMVMRALCSILRWSPTTASSVNHFTTLRRSGLDSDQEDGELDVRSKKPVVIQITRFRDGMRLLPNFIELGHRHLQKERPVAIAEGLTRIYTVPVDMLRVLKLPEFIINEIEEVQVAYKKR